MTGRTWKKCAECIPDRHPYCLALAIVAAIGGCGAVIAGERAIATLDSWQQPYFAPPLATWLVAGSIYSGVMVLALGRLLKHYGNDHWPPVAVISILVANEAWNALVAFSTYPHATLVALVPYTALVGWAGIVSYRQDMIAAALIGLYLLWLGFDAYWLWSLVELNPIASHIEPSRLPV